MKKIVSLVLILVALSCAQPPDPFVSSDAVFKKAAANGILANEAFRRCRRYVEGWLRHADPQSGLIPRNLDRDKDIWNAQDAAADNYPFMVLTAALTDRDLFDGRMRGMLETETRLTSRLGHLPDTYSFSKMAFLDTEADIHRLIFGGSEYVKDGLLPLTEWLGPSPWTERLVGILDDIWTHAPFETPYGPIPSDSQEVNGEMLQTLSRVYWMTGEQKYLDHAVRLADYYLFDSHPTRDHARLRLRDHGCEILSGLVEAYAAVDRAAPEKKKAYEKPIHDMLDRVLEVGRNEHGLLYNSINPQTGEHEDRLCDTWGYNYNGFYTVYLMDGTDSYRQAVILALSNLNEHYRDYDWESGSADGDADAVESALNLYNREPVQSAAEWIDNQIRTMWGKQQEDGVIEGWHGDGNFARTSLQYALWKSKGITLQPWRDDCRLGAEQREGAIYISLSTEFPWQGKVIFDMPRHRTHLHLPMDYPRINQFPEWFTVEAERKYIVYIGSREDRNSYSGRELSDGLTLQSEPGSELRLIVIEARR
jgi:hypothetical protein